MRVWQTGPDAIQRETTIVKPAKRRMWYGYAGMRGSMNITTSARRPNTRKLAARVCPKDGRVEWKQGRVAKRGISGAAMARDDDVEFAKTNLRQVNERQARTLPGLGQLVNEVASVALLQLLPLLSNHLQTRATKKKVMVREKRGRGEDWVVDATWADEKATPFYSFPPRTLGENGNRSASAAIRDI